MHRRTPNRTMNPIAPARLPTMAVLLAFDSPAIPDGSCAEGSGPASTVGSWLWLDDVLVVGAKDILVRYAGVDGVPALEKVVSKEKAGHACGVALLVKLDEIGVEEDAIVSWDVLGTVDDVSVGLDDAVSIDEGKLTTVVVVVTTVWNAVAITG